MSTTNTTEQRLTLLEEQVRQLQAQRERETVSGKTTPDFLEQFVGIFADDPAFPEAVRLGREWRDTDNPTPNPDLA